MLEVIHLFYTPISNICVPVVHHQLLCLWVFWTWAILIGMRNYLTVESKLHFVDDYWTHFHELTIICILSFAKFLIYLFGIVWHFIIYLEKSFFIFWLQMYCSVNNLCVTLQPHELQHARLPCPSPAPGDCSNSCHPTSPPLSSTSLPAFNLSQHQGLFKWVSSSNQVAKVFGFELQHQSFQGILRTDFL